MQVIEFRGRPKVPDGVIMSRVIMAVIDARMPVTTEYLRQTVTGQAVRVTAAVRRLEQVGLLRRGRRGRLYLDPERLQDLLGDEVKVEVRRR